MHAGSRQIHVLSVLVPVTLCLAGCGGGGSANDGDTSTPSDATTLDTSVDLSVDTAAPDTTDTPTTTSCPGGGQPPCWLWARTLQGPSIEDEIDGVAADADGNVYITGKFEQSLTLQGDPGAPLVSAGAADIMVAKYDRDGQWLWTKQFGGSGEDNLFDASCDADGNLVLSGAFSGAVTFGDVALDTGADDNADAVFLKLSPAGDVLWAVHGAGAGAEDGGNEVAIAPDGTVLVGAQAEGRLDIYAGADRNIDMTLTPPAGLDQSLVLALAPDTGEPRWGGHLTAPASRSKCLGVDGLGNVYMGGDFRGTATIKPGDADSSSLDPLTATGTSPDAFYSKWSASGELLHAEAWGGPGEDLCKGIAGLADGGIYIIGYYEGEVTFDGITLPGDTDHEEYAWHIGPDGQTRWLVSITSPGDTDSGELELSDDEGLLYGATLTGATRFGQADGTDVVAEMPAGGEGVPVLVHYGRDGQVRDLVRPQSALRAIAGELAMAPGGRVYMDVVVGRGDFVLGADAFSIDGAKDGAIAAIALQ